MTNKKDNTIKTQEEKVTQAIKLKDYEDFEDVAERLRKEGRLNDRNYKKIKRNRLLVLSIVLLLTILVFFVSKILFFLFLAFFIFLVSGTGINRLCYLYTFGKKTNGIVLEVKKEFIRNKQCRFFYDVVFEFNNGSKTIKLIQIDDWHNRKLNKNYKVGEKVEVFYNPKNPYDALISNSKQNYFNLLLTKNK